MATGWAGDGAVQDQIDSTVDDAVKRARARLPRGPSLKHCEECDAKIPEARRKAVPGVRLCVDCQEAQRRTPGTALRRASGIFASHSSQCFRLGPRGSLARARLTASSTVESIWSCTAPSPAPPVAMGVSEVRWRRA